MKSTAANTRSPASAACLAIYTLVAAFALAPGCQSAAKPKAATGALQGVVFDLDKTPVSGALIEIEGQGVKAGATTDSQGRFSFPDLATGDYEVSFSKAMHERRDWNFTLSDFTEAVYLQAAGYWQLLDAAMTALGKRDLGEAEDCLERAKGIQDESSTSLFLAGVLAEKRGDYASAIGDLEKAAALDPRSPYLWLYLADLYERSSAGAGKESAALDKYLELRDDPAAEARREGLN